jgi:hypothetical protein
LQSFSALILQYVQYDLLVIWKSNAGHPLYGMTLTSSNPPTLHHHGVFSYFFAKARKISSAEMHVFYISQLWFCRPMGGLFPNFNENIGRKAKKCPSYACFFCLVFVFSV